MESEPEWKTYGCLIGHVATVQQRQFDLQQNDAVVTILEPLLLQIRQQCRNVRRKALICLLYSSQQPSNVTTFQITAATPADIPRVLAMIQALADFEKLRHLCIATEVDLEAALFGDRPTVEVVLGCEDASPVAFALFFHNFSTFLGRKGLYLEDLFVLPEFRGKGYGRALLVYLARLALERGCGRFEWAVLDWNVAAIRFYESLGATVMPDWRIARTTGSVLAALAAQPMLER